jgi:hypothetical protein
MTLSFEQILIEVWRQTLVENAKTVELGSERHSRKSARARTFEPSCPEEFEPLRECLADMIAEGWVTQRRPLRIYNLAPAGHQNFKPRIQALRALGKS